MTVYRYDGSFTGLLCALARSSYGPEPAGFLRPHEAAGLFDRVTEVATEASLAAAFGARCGRLISTAAVDTLHYAFQSEAAGVEVLLWRYLRLGFRVGGRLEAMQADPQVQPVQQLARRVQREAHRFLGFVRFREVCWPGGGQFLYAAIEPEHDLLVFLAPHFSERLGERPWAIHDLRRRQALFGEHRRVTLERGVALAAVPQDSGAEVQVAGLWRRYFQRLAIQERHNPQLQQQLVPLRYRRHLTEFT